MTLSDPTLDCPIQIWEINDVISKLSTHKAAGHDGIPNELWKILTLSCKKELVKHLNTILHNEAVPEAWVLSLLYPIFKKGDASDPKNYRPIASLKSTNKYNGKSPQKMDGCKSKTKQLSRGL
jgi:hypothetical protein